MRTITNLQEQFDWTELEEWWRYSIRNQLVSDPHILSFDAVKLEFERFWALVVIEYSEWQSQHEGHTACYFEGSHLIAPPIVDEVWQHVMFWPDRVEILFSVLDLPSLDRAVQIFYPDFRGSTDHADRRELYRDTVTEYQRVFGRSPPASIWPPVQMYQPAAPPLATAFRSLLAPIQSEANATPADAKPPVTNSSSVPAAGSAIPSAKITASSSSNATLPAEQAARATPFSGLMGAFSGSANKSVAPAPVSAPALAPAPAPAPASAPAVAAPAAEATAPKSTSGVSSAATNASTTASATATAAASPSPSTLSFTSASTSASTTTAVVVPAWYIDASVGRDNTLDCTFFPVPYMGDTRASAQPPQPLREPSDAYTSTGPAPRPKADVVMCMTAWPAFASRSLEELRVQDVLANQARNDKPAFVFHTGSGLPDHVSLPAVPPLAPSAITSFTAIQAQFADTPVSELPPVRAASGPASSEAASAFAAWHAPVQYVPRTRPAHAANRIPVTVHIVQPLGVLDEHLTRRVQIDMRQPFGKQFSDTPIQPDSPLMRIWIQRQPLCENNDGRTATAMCNMCGWLCPACQTSCRNTSGRNKHTLQTESPTMALLTAADLGRTGLELQLQADDRIGTPTLTHALAMLFCVFLFGKCVECVSTTWVTTVFSRASRLVILAWGACELTCLHTGTQTGMEMLRPDNHWPRTAWHRPFRLPFRVEQEVDVFDLENRVAY